jgi:hypothetical protein
VTDKTSSTESRSRRTELEANRAARAKADEEHNQKSELEELELEEHFEEKLGRRGAEYEIVDFTAQHGGFVVVQRGEAVLHKKFMSDVEKSAVGVPEKAFRDYVVPCVVHPSKEAFLELAEKMPRAWRRCANAVMALQGERKKVEEGKF